jgi:hypothetical protein
VNLMRTSSLCAIGHGSSLVEGSPKWRMVEEEREAVKGRVRGHRD